MRIDVYIWRRDTEGKPYHRRIFVDVPSTVFDRVTGRALGTTFGEIEERLRSDGYGTNTESEYTALRSHPITDKTLEYYTED